MNFNNFKQTNDNYKPLKLLSLFLLILDIGMFNVLNFKYFVGLIVIELIFMAFFQALRFRYCPECKLKMKLVLEYEKKWNLSFML